MSEQQSQDLKPAASAEHTRFCRGCSGGAETAASEQPSSESSVEKGALSPRFQDLLLGTAWPAELKSPLGEWGGD